MNETKPALPVAAKPSFRFPWLTLAVFWLLNIGLGYVGLHMFILFLARAGLTLLLVALLGGWWLFRAPLSLRARIGWAAFALVCCIVSTLLLHPLTLPPVVWMWSIPLLFTLGTLWLHFASAASPAVQQLGLAGVVVLAWLPGPLVRMNALKGDGSADIYWRFTPSAEDKFLKVLPVSHEVPPAAEVLTATPEDWTVFRGPTGDGRALGPTIATDWKTSPPKVLWKKSVGPAWSSMIVVGERLFTQEQRGEQEATTCYAADTGDLLWVHEHKERFEESLSGIGPRCTPTFADGRIYAVGARGRLDCLNASDGKLIWTKDTLADFQSKPPIWGISASPVVHAGKVFIFAGGEKEHAFAAYDAVSGDIAWKAEAGRESYSSPILVTLHERPQVLYLGEKSLHSFDPETGERLWEFAAESAGRPTLQPQVVDGSKLLLSFSPDHLFLIDVLLTDGNWSTKEVWKTNAIKPDFSDYLVRDGYLYGFDADIFCCLDLANGKRKWKGGRYGAGQAILPVADRPCVIVLTEKGSVVLIACNPQKREELVELPAITGKTWNHPILCRGRLYVRSSEEMACWELPLAATP